MNVLEGRAKTVRYGSTLAEANAYSQGLADAAGIISDDRHIAEQEKANAGSTEWCALEPGSIRHTLARIKQVRNELDGLR